MNPSTAAGMIERTAAEEPSPGSPPVPHLISRNDGMFEGDRDHYFSVGRSALECIRPALCAAGRKRVNNILDFGSGFGRVLRALKAAFPDAHITACDLSQEAIEFCAQTFSAEPIHSSEDVSQIRIDGKFDLIWCGTLLTNVASSQFGDFLELFRSLLSPSGILVFTTHGPFVARRLKTGSHDYGLPTSQIQPLIEEYERYGFGYRDYPQDVLLRLGVRHYGISVCRPSWVIRQLENFEDIEILGYTEKAWDRHQDSVAIKHI